MGLTIEYRMISKVEKMDIHKLPKQQIDTKKNDLDSSKHNADRSGLSFTQTGRTECKVVKPWDTGMGPNSFSTNIVTWLTSHNQDSSVHLRHVHYNYNPIGSMYGIYANIWGILMVNVTIYGIHGSYGNIFVTRKHMVFLRSSLHIGVQISDPEITSDLFILARHGGIGYNHYIYIYIYIYISGQIIIFH